MLSFISFLIEKKIDPSAKSRQDSMGKLNELLIGKELNRGQFPDFYADSRNTRPIHAHELHGEALFGRDFKGSFYEHDDYKRMINHASEASDKLREYIRKKYGITDLSRIAWTSQAKDVAKELGDPNAKSKADLIVTSGHPEHKGMKLGLNIKYGKTETPNYGNPGVASFEQIAGVPLQHHVEEHANNLQRLGRVKHAEFRALDTANHPKAQAIKDSADNMHLKIARDMRNSLSTKSDKELRSIVKKATAPESSLPEITVHTIVNDDGTATHRVMDHHEHVDNYLNNFDNLHVDPNAKGKTVTIHGIHKKTGKKMPVWHTTIYSGGAPETTTARGMIKLSSEDKVD